MKQVSATDARKNLFDLIELAGKPGASVMIKHRDLPDVVLLSVEEFEGWMETLEILSDKALTRSIGKALREKKVIPLEKLEEEGDAQGSHVSRRSQKTGARAVRKAGRKR